MLTDGVLEEINVRFNESEKWLVVERGPLTVACNLAEAPRKLALSAGLHRVVLASGDDCSFTEGSIQLPPDAVAILKREA